MRIATFACLGVLASCGRVDHARLALEKLTTGRLVEAEIEAELHATTATAGASAFRDAIQACTSHARALASAADAKTVDAWLLSITEMQRAFDLWCVLAVRGDERARRNAERSYLALQEFRAAAAEARERAGQVRPLAASTADQELVQRLLERLRRTQGERQRPTVPSSVATGAKDW
ncbi:MAG: hypothetical protein KDB80_12080 [Planctomycetes bacterium]|nr:hypothetical protein [Planctomycetota bacterium]